MDTGILEKVDGRDGGHGEDDRKIEIIVNERSVVMLGQEHTGREIKDAAIAQGVKIGPDFVLSVEKGGGKTQVIGDTDSVKLHPHERFVAIADDDNS